MNLTHAKLNTNYRIINLNLDIDTKRRLEILGLTPGSTVSALGSKKGGSMIIKIRGSRFAIGKPFAEGIEIGGEENGQ